jgi:hypothetical protein
LLNFLFTLVFQFLFIFYPIYGKKHKTFKDFSKIFQKQQGSR